MALLDGLAGTYLPVKEMSHKPAVVSEQDIIDFYAATQSMGYFEYAPSAAMKRLIDATENLAHKFLSEQMWMGIATHVVMSMFVDFRKLKTWVTKYDDPDKIIDHIRQGKASWNDLAEYIEIYGGPWVATAKEIAKLADMLPISPANLREAMLQLDRVIDVEHNSGLILGEWLELVDHRGENIYEAREFLDKKSQSWDADFYKSHSPALWNISERLKRHYKRAKMKIAQLYGPAQSEGLGLGGEGTQGVPNSTNLPPGHQGHSGSGPWSGDMITDEKYNNEPGVKKVTEYTAEELIGTIKALLKIRTPESLDYARFLKNMLDSKMHALRAARRKFNLTKVAEKEKTAFELKQDPFVIALFADHELNLDKLDEVEDFPENLTHFALHDLVHQLLEKEGQTAQPIKGDCPESEKTVYLSQSDIVQNDYKADCPEGDVKVDDLKNKKSVSIEKYKKHKPKKSKAATTDIDEQQESEVGSPVQQEIKELIDEIKKAQEEVSQMLTSVQSTRSFDEVLQIIDDVNDSEKYLNLLAWYRDARERLRLLDWKDFDIPLDLVDPFRKATYALYGILDAHNPSADLGSFTAKNFYDLYAAAALAPYLDRAPNAVVRRVTDTIEEFARRLVTISRLESHQEIISTLAAAVQEYSISWIGEALSDKYGSVDALLAKVQEQALDADTLAALFSGLLAIAGVWGGKPHAIVAEETGKLKEMLPVTPQNAKEVAAQVDHIIDLEHNTDLFLRDWVDMSDAQVPEGFEGRFNFRALLDHKSQEWDWDFFKETSPQFYNMFQQMKRLHLAKLEKILTRFAQENPEIEGIQPASAIPANVLEMMKQLGTAVQAGDLREAYEIYRQLPQQVKNSAITNLRKYFDEDTVRQVTQGPQYTNEEVQQALRERGFERGEEVEARLSSGELATTIAKALGANLTQDEQNGRIVYGIWRMGAEGKTLYNVQFYVAPEMNAIQLTHFNVNKQLRLLHDPDRELTPDIEEMRRQLPHPMKTISDVAGKYGYSVQSPQMLELMKQQGIKGFVKRADANIVDQELKFTSKEQEVIDAVAEAADRLDIDTYIVGGAVRDRLLDEEDADLDFMCERDAERMVKYLSQKYGTEDPVEYERSQAMMVTIGDQTLDFINAEQLFRPMKEDSPLEGEEEFTVSLDDAYRRDLTINSIMYDIRNDRIVDPTGQGLKDLRNKKLNTIIDPFIKYKIHAADMLRALRFAATLEGFELGPKMLDAMRANAERIRPRDVGGDISNRRIRRELRKTIDSPEHWAKMRALLKEAGLDIILAKDVSDVQQDFVGGIDYHFNEDTKAMTHIKGFTKRGGPFDWFKSKKQTGPVTPAKEEELLQHLAQGIDKALARTPAAKHDQVIQQMVSGYRSVTPEMLLQLKVLLKNYKPSTGAGRTQYPDREPKWID